MTPTTDTRPLSSTATNIDANTRGTTRRSIGEMPSTSIASISSRILRLPRSAQMADPPAQEISSAQTIGAASRMMASTAAEPVNDWAPTCRDRLPICRAMTAPNGIETRAVGRIVTLARNQPCSIASRHWNRRWMIERNSCTIVSRQRAKKPPLCRNGAARVADVIDRSSLVRRVVGALARRGLSRRLSGSGRLRAVAGGAGRARGTRGEDANRSAVAVVSVVAAAGAPLGRVLGRRGRRGRRRGLAVPFLAGERAGWRLDVVLLQPLARRALGAAGLPVARGDLRRDRRQRRQLLALFLLGGELRGVLLLGHADRSLTARV